MTVQAPPLDVSTRAGCGQLAVEVVSGKSAATVVEAHSPLKILVPRPRGQSVWAYLSNFGGGLLPGDEIDFSISVIEGARCFLGTQSSTKIFRGGAKGAVKNRFAAEINSGGLLVYAPDVAQSFATSRYVQTQSIRLADESANLVFVDWYSSGRAARDERWSFSEYSSRNEIRVNNRLIFLDSIRLDAADDLIALGERFGRINCVATAVILGTELEKYATEGAKEVAASPISKRADILETASAIPGGCVFRFAGVSVEAVARRLISRIDFVSSLLGDNPFQRKW
ncbi:MAG TPA: urease accessory protein UreD [Verrucomicrobiae bacterium]|nr:urease accessory protein UreD [Verrucomicrobiae bacterium]